MKFKRFIAMFLCVMMLVSLMPNALADKDGGLSTNSSTEETTDETAAEEAVAEEAEEAEEEKPSLEDTPVYVFPERTAVPFDEMVIGTYDEEAANLALEVMESAIEQEGSLTLLKRSWNVIVDQYDKYYTDYTLANIKYMQDSNVEGAYELYFDLQQGLIAFSDRLCTVMRAVLESPYGDDMITYIGSEDVVADFVDYIPMTDEEFALSEERTKLEDDYYDVVASGARVSRVKCEKIYLALLDNFIASLEYTDYDNYSEYMYAEGYSRDYTLEDIAVMKEWAKDFIVPYYFGVVNAIVSNEKLDAYYSKTLSDEEIIAAVQPYVSTVSEEAAETFSMMLEYGLVDIAASETKNDGGFTTGINLYGVPFTYNSPYGYMGDMQTLIHEFGHYYEQNHTMKPMMYDYSTIDVAEINSQGMEVLMMKYYNDIYGSLGTVATLMNLYSLLGSIIDGCIWDEFQQRAVAGRIDGTITKGQDLTDLYLSIEFEYFDDMYSTWGEDWWQVSHTFTSPFYYISYATSATAALGFLMMADEDYDAAVEAYVELIDIGTENGFLETLEMIGMPLPTTEEGCAQLSEGIGDYLSNVVGITPLVFR